MPLTPALDVGILESITRDRIVRELHIEEGAFQVEDLRGTHEAFLASTVREVQPVSAIDGPGSCRNARRSDPRGSGRLRTVLSQEMKVST